MFIKNGDGKILSVIKEDDLDENQKLSVKKISEKSEPSIEKTDVSDKKQGAK
jgi:hypothetical protein